MKAAKPILGRPKLDKGQAKSVIICGRFTANEANQIAQAVTRSKVPQSAWVRQAVLEKARRIAPAG